ncbi:peptide chain release factor N(5)-glutamine methyltransferase [Alkalibacter mobilis]|uniref:peptide chain release factor N(5)-glutamine methyltransferase n=1 Tax=Alkalibacter mobilis TaxID=2787712 RepID=UPI00189EBC52|nr:peptide chain release factor N(5)-glutamine methyltransferase [Alkalibacter mobilis]MBF7096058.1 peptide chain release factor N(5)-glutamine methyltransferase [Alkalibacter mobilis]
MNIQELLIKGTKILKEKNISTARLDSEILLAERLNKERSYFLSHYDREISKDIEVSFFEDITRRCEMEPIAYIIGKKEFMGLEFEVNRNVLIPRPDTEILVETAIEILKDKGEYASVLDMGTGSGAIGISLANYLPKIRVTAVDVDEAALETAKRNGARLNVANRMDFVLSDCFKGLKEMKFDIIVSNPPYIDLKEMGELEPNVANYEPRKALFGGHDGLDFYREIAMEAPRFLKEQGHLIFEIGCGQSKDVMETMGKAGFKSIITIKDLSGLDRVVIGQLK